MCMRKTDRSRIPTSHNWKYKRAIFQHLHNTVVRRADQERDWGCVPPLPAPEPLSQHFLGKRKLLGIVS